MGTFIFPPGDIRIPYQMDWPTSRQLESEWIKTAHPDDLSVAFMQRMVGRYHHTATASRRQAPSFHYTALWAAHTRMHIWYKIMNKNY